MVAKVVSRLKIISRLGIFAGNWAMIFEHVEGQISKRNVSI